MNTPRTSPIYDQLLQLNGSWQEINGMRSLVSVNDQVNTDRLGIADLSFLTRFGVKGAGAAAWLASQEIPIPERPNTWCQLQQGGIVARLGMSEFLIEDSLHSQIAPQLTTACQQPPVKVYPILRQDAAIALIGSEVNELLLQTCSFNFRTLSLAERPVILTAMVGVTVTVIPNQQDGIYRIWCDRTFGAYLWQTLLAIAVELGGGAIGVETLQYRCNTVEIL